MKRSVRCFQKRYCSRSAFTGQPWLSQPLESHPMSTTPKGHMRSSSTFDASTKLTTLKNGIRVVSQNSQDGLCTVGLGIEAGSRYEMFSPAGVTHFLEKLAFNSTEKYNSKIDIFEELEKYGGICDSQFSRDVAFYALSVRKDSLKNSIQILSESALQPLISSEEMEMAANLVAFDLEDHEESLLRMQPEKLLHDMIHRAAFRGNTIGLPKFCPPENLTSIKKSDILSFMKTYFLPERMVLSGVNIDHQMLCDLVEKHFDLEKAVFKDSAKLELDESVAQYTGGELKTNKAMTPVTGGENPLPELAHIVIGLESVPATHPDFVAINVLSFLMGGGSSFSSGGPGKGMYSRMYLNLLNRYGYIQHASVHNHPYRDAGLFELKLASTPDMVRDTCQKGVIELLQMTGNIDDTELTRAKNQLKSSIVMHLEMKPIQMEENARQVLAQGKVKSPQEECALIDEVTKEDIRRVADKLLSSKISVAALGQISMVPSQRDLTHCFIHDGKWPDSKSSFFSKSK